MAKKEKQYEDWGTAAVSELSNIRMDKMVFPKCGPCQREFPVNPRTNHPEKRWWVICEQRGHDPYWEEVPPVTQVQPVYETNELNETIIKGEKLVVVEPSRRRLNIRQVAQNPRINSGRGIDKARHGKGAKYPSELGFANVCNYRNCTKEIKYSYPSYGEFCSRRHAVLVAADKDAIILPEEHSPDVAAIKDVRSKKLRELANALDGEDFI